MKITAPRLDWPQVVLVLGLAALGALVVLYGPEELHAPLASLLVVVAGGARSFLGGPPAPPAPPSYDPPTRPTRRTMPPSAMRIALALALALSGCGASALRAHSTAATIASIAVGDLDARAASACDVALTACAGETVCVSQTAERCRVAGRVGDAVVASVRAYVDAVEVAAHADEGAVLPALLAAWRGIRDLWPAVAAALEALGLDVPALPLLGGGS